MCPEDPESSASRSRALNDNPAIADWFFHERIVRYIEAVYIHVLGVTDIWLRFEWQHRGSPHVHGLAWLTNAPDVDSYCYCFCNYWYVMSLLLPFCIIGCLGPKDQ